MHINLLLMAEGGLQEGNDACNKLLITVERARGLAAADNSSSDPYAQLKVGYLPLQKTSMYT